MHQYRISEIINAIVDNCASGGSYGDTIVPVLENCGVTEYELEFLGLGWLADIMFGKEEGNV